MEKSKKKNKHMTLDDRIEIQECLCKEMTFKAIAKRIEKSQTTVSREIKLHMQTYTNGHVRSDDVCPKLLKAPFVCNGCDKKSRSSCPYRRQIYSAKSAQAAYEDLLKESRSGIPLNKEEFYETERVISDAVRHGQHIYHAILANKLPVSTATVYRHIKKKYYSIGVIDLPRAVKFKPRKTNQTEVIPAQAKKGRTYNDYLDFIEQNSDLTTVQLDTVIGRIGGKVIMTIHFVSCDFMFGLLLDNKTSVEASNKIIALKLRLSENHFCFGDIIPLFLTDNGGEFSNVSAFEDDADGNTETKLFFCSPRSPEEKPHIEKNHTMFRDIVQSGTSFDDFTQETVDLIFSHVNSVKRKQFNGKSAYDMFTFSYSRELAVIFGISEIPAKQVIQSPKLLKISSHS
mgnify:FL=1